MLQFKTSVTVFGLCQEILWALDRTEQVYGIYGNDCTVTSGRGDSHSRESFHYAGRAVDIRTRDIDSDTLTAIVSVLKRKLGKNFDVILESNHLHVEYQPRDVHAYPTEFPFR